MNCGTASARAILAWATLVVAGCATTRRESPPEVIAQPPDISAVAAVAAAAPANAARAGRYRPTTRSVQEIRDQRAATAPPLDFQQRIDQAHDRVYVWTQGAVEATDRRFASQNEELKPTPAAPFRLGLTFESIDRSDGAQLAFDVNLDIALGLPNVEDRLRVFITSDDPDESPRDARDGSTLRAGLRYQLRRHLDFDLGVRLDVPPVAFTSVKWTREIPLGTWDFYPFAKLFAETREGVGTAAGATFDQWSGRRLLRSSTYAKWRADLGQTQWSQAFVYARARQLLVPERYGSYVKANDIGRGWGVRLLASGEDISAVTYYEAGVFYVRPTANNWLFWSVGPLLRWDRQYAWKADPGVRVGINALFWDLARPAR